MSALRGAVCPAPPLELALMVQLEGTSAVLVPLMMGALRAKSSQADNCDSNAGVLMVITMLPHHQCDVIT